MIKFARTAPFLLHLPVLFLMVAGSVQQANAAPVCQTASLADYMRLNSTGGCTYNDLTFFRFAFSPAPVATGGASLATAADIQIAPLSSELGTGFSFASSFFAISNSEVPQSVTYNIAYSVDPPPIIVGEDLFLDPPYGDVRVTERLCLNDVLANSCAFGVPLEQGVTPISPVSSVQFPYAVPFVDVLTTITLNSTPGNPAGFDALQSGTLTNVAPEPGSFLLGAAGIVCGGVLQYVRRRTRR